MEMFANSMTCVCVLTGPGSQTDTQPVVHCVDTAYISLEYNCVLVVEVSSIVAAVHM